jgi:light-regulated signal transduction histidine kinase (bacteriophytochrome)
MSGAPEVDRRDGDLYEEMTRLNNELATAQRVLAQRNGELAQLAAMLDLRVAERTDQLQNANAELETLAFAMAHDLRAPARHVEAFAEMLEDSAAAQLAPRERDWLAKMRAASRLQSALIEAILAYLRLGSAPMHRESLDMNAEVALAIKEVGLEGAQAPVSWSIETLPPAFADRALVREILRNLVGNAVKFTSLQAAPAIEIGSRQHDGEVAFFIRDNGAGFDAQRAVNMFKPFERMHTESEFPGLGMGLAIIRRLVLRHGGRVWAESTPRHGATFHFTLGSNEPPTA